MTIKKVIKYVGNDKSICILVQTNDNNYYILAAKTSHLWLEGIKSEDDFFKLNLTKIIHGQIKLSCEIEQVNNILYRMIKIKNPEFFDDAVNIIQSFIGD